MEEGMKKSVDILLVARDSLPYPGTASDAWLLTIVLELLAPLERDCMDVLLLGEPRDGCISTPDLAADIGRTLEQMGAITSRLRSLGLIETDCHTTEEGRVACHRAVAWVVKADRYRLEQQRDAFKRVLQQAKEPSS
jgi:hypothetical protein